MTKAIAHLYALLGEMKLKIILRCTGDTKGKPEFMVQ